MKLSIFRNAILFTLMTFLTTEAVGVESTANEHLEIVFRTDAFDGKYSQPLFCERPASKMIYIDGHEIKTLDFDDTKRVLFKVDGVINDQNLACSNDGQFISATDTTYKFLYVFEKQLSIYELEALPTEYGDRLTGHLSVMSHNAKTFVLPGIPHLVSGPDVLATKKVIMSGFQVFGWVDQQPYTLDNPGKLNAIDRDSGRLTPVFNPPRKTNVSGITQCSGEPYIWLFHDGKDGLIYPLRDGILDKEHRSHGDILITNGSSCLYERQSPNKSVWLSDGVRSVTYVAKPNKTIFFDGSDAEILNTIHQFSGSGCLLSTYVTDDRGVANILIIRNPFGPESCAGR